MRITNLKYNFSHLTIKTLFELSISKFPFFYFFIFTMMQNKKLKKNVGFMIIFNYIIASKIKQMKF